MHPLDDDPLLQLIGSGTDLWADEHADEYVRRVREGWDDRTAWDLVEEEAKRNDGVVSRDPLEPSVPEDDTTE